ncbi:hypothetical protein D3C77_232060 [compost metagenome]
MVGSVNFSLESVLRSLSLKNGAQELVANPGHFVYKNDTGSVDICNYEHLAAERYEEVSGTENSRIAIMNATRRII